MNKISLETKTWEPLVLTSRDLKKIEEEGTWKWLSDNSDRIILCPLAAPADYYTQESTQNEAHTVWSRICRIWSSFCSFLVPERSASAAERSEVGWRRWLGECHENN